MNQSYINNNKSVSRSVSSQHKKEGKRNKKQACLRNNKDVGTCTSIDCHQKRTHSGECQFDAKCTKEGCDKPHPSRMTCSREHCNRKDCIRDHSHQLCIQCGKDYGYHLGYCKDCIDMRRCANLRCNLYITPTQFSNFGAKALCPECTHHEYKLSRLEEAVTCADAVCFKTRQDIQKEHGSIPEKEEQLIAKEREIANLEKERDAELDPIMKELLYGLDTIQKFFLADHIKRQTILKDVDPALKEWLDKVSCITKTDKSVANATLSTILKQFSTPLNQQKAPIEQKYRPLVGQAKKELREMEKEWREMVKQLRHAEWVYKLYVWIAHMFDVDTHADDCQLVYGDGKIGDHITVGFCESNISEKKPISMRCTCQQDPEETEDSETILSFKLNDIEWKELGSQD